MKKGCQHKVHPRIISVYIFFLIHETLMNKNIPVSEVSEGGGGARWPYPAHGLTRTHTHAPERGKSLPFFWTEVW